MQSKPLFFKASLLFLLCSTTHAFNTPPFVVSGDVDYKIIKSSKQEVIYDPKNRKEAEDFFQKSQDLHQKYEKSFDFNLTQTNYTGLASHHNQVSNGYATFLPLLMNGFYSGGSAHIDYFGSLSWMDMLLIHEFAHTYQLDAKTGFSNALQTVLGNNGAWFINPNYLLPTIVIEGNAVMNESRFGIGGRLHVGQHRALVYALSKDKMLNYTRLLNNHLSFPYGSEKYLVGGYLWAYIANRFGMHKANAYFKQHATHYIIPFRINKSFEEHFGVDYETVVTDFLAFLQNKSQKMHFLEGKELAVAHRIGDLNADEKSIYWMQSDEMGPNEKVVFNKVGKISKEKSSHLLNKLFNIDGMFYTSSQAQIDANHITSGLFDDKLNLKKSSEDFFIFDKRSGHEVGFYIPDSYATAKLYKDQKFYKEVDSSAILDDEANVYYAKQKGQIRELYKNDKVIASWKGYSQKLLEVRDEKVFFIGATAFGSSLFYAKNAKTFRVSKADNIVDARFIDNKTILAVAVRGDQYHILKTSIETAIDEKPYMYHYALEQEHLSALPKFEHTKSKVYKPSAEMHYAFIDQLSYAYSSEGVDGVGLGFRFADPMQQNQLHVGASVYNGNVNGSLIYENRKNLLYYGVGGYFSESYTNSVDVRLSYPIMKKERTALKTTLSTVSFFDKNSIDYGLFGSLNYHNGEFYGIAYDWHAFNAWNFAYLQTNKNYYAVTDLKNIWEIFPSLFIYSTFEAQTTDDVVSIGGYSYYDQFYAFYPGYVATNSYELNIYTNNIGKLSLETAYAFKSGLYFDVFPFSLRRTALKLQTNYYLLENLLDYDGSIINANSFDFYEVKGSVDFEILGFHLAPFNLELAINYNSYVDNTEFLFQIGINY